MIHKASDTKQTYLKAVNILVCENDPITMEFLKSILEKNGFNVILTHTAAEAKKMLTELKIDALLIDLILPDQDGISFIKDIRSFSHMQDLPVIIISLIAHPGMKKFNGATFSVLDWIQKPIDLDRLLTVITHLKNKIASHTPPYSSC